ncbi:MAG: DUF3800 domain-containing protein [Patescibacteria group bacterium]
MYIFIDESGVHKREGKSSIALVYLSVDNLDILQNVVIETENEMKIKNFHWAHSTWGVRKKFIEIISRQDFKIKIALIKNPFYADQAYEYALQHLVIERDIISMIIDGKKGRAYERKLKKVLRDKGISVKKLKTASDESFPALRVADAVAGIIRYRDEFPDNPKIEYLYKLIYKKILITLG